MGVLHRNMAELYPNALGFMDSETIKGSDTQAGWSLFPRNQIPEMKPLRKWTQVQNSLATLKSRVSGSRGLLNFPKHSLKNWAYHDVMCAQKEKPPREQTKLSASL